MFIYRCTGHCALVLSGDKVGTIEIYIAKGQLTVDEVMKLCQAENQICALYAINNFRVGERKK